MLRNHNHQYIHIKTILLAIFLQIGASQLLAQNYYTISGSVKDHNTGKSIANSAVGIRNSNIGVFTDKQGNYLLCDILEGKYELIINSVGYNNDTIKIDLNTNITLNINLIATDIKLQEVVINENQSGARINSFISSLRPSAPAMLDYATTNFTKILSNSAGMASMDVGANITKPVIRGLSFNRIAVINRGVTVQNQQWGVDHGLEINSFDVNSVTIYKGANSLLFGSDAMAGAIEIRGAGPSFDKTTLTSELDMWAASNNETGGAAVLVERNSPASYFKITASYQEYGDYRVPADKFYYLYYNLDIPGKRLKNTAGRENNLSASYGIWGKQVKTIFYIGSNYTKNGFFAGAHGFPDPSKLLDDGSYRNIDYPNNTANHITFTNNTDITLPLGRLSINTGFQYNHRQENSYFHTHYMNVQQPDSKDPNLELDFRLKTYSANARLFLNSRNNWQNIIGISTEWQQNKVGGYNFFLPRFDQSTGGIYAITNYNASRTISYNGGLRFDMAHTHITGYYDHILAEDMKLSGYSDNEIEEYAWRSHDTKRNFASLSGVAGVSYKPDGEQELYATLGKSFRFPTAVELGANGIHHGAFRHEIGNSNLKAEQGYSVDFGYKYNSNDDKWNISLMPFINYFSNFIYLQPSKQYSLLPHAGQLYNYTQAKALYAGGELDISYHLKSGKNTTWIFTSISEYVYNKNLDNKYPLPFTPPFTMKNQIEYLRRISEKNITDYHLAVSHRWYANQNHIAQGEENTPGANLLAISAGFDYKCRYIKNTKIQVELRADNIFNTSYLNHLSYYRKLNIPEPGRNIQLFIRIPFTSNK